MPFAKLRLIDPLLRAVKSEGYTIPTAIQKLAIPHVLEGKDLLGCAQTGTGKTAAFALPILQRLHARPAAPKVEPAGAHPGAAGAQPTGHAPAAHAGASHGGGAHASSSTASGHHGPGGARPAQGGPAGRGTYVPAEPHRTGIAARAGRRTIRALVITPTRELAAQIGDSFRVYGQHTGLRHTTIFGGVSQGPQAQALHSGVDILVATPGRLLDLLNQRLLNLHSVEVFVLDEADRMLDMGFINDIRRVIAQLPVERQTLMFSATMPREIMSLANTILRQPVEVRIPTESPAADTVKQGLYFIDTAGKGELLEFLLKDPAMTRALVFTRTKHGADKVVRRLDHAEISAEAIHSNKSQNARQRALDNFKKGKTRVLVASDIAARGLDVDDISHVINYDLPMEPETYVHRIGRTGRAGAQGQALSFCAPEQRADLRDIERLLGRPIPVLQHSIKVSPAAAAAAAERRQHGSQHGRPQRYGHGGATRGEGSRPPAHAAGTSQHKSPLPEQQKKAFWGSRNRRGGGHGGRLRAR
jgi:ATP-dependent RNA helicase RhlE